MYTANHIVMQVVQEGLQNLRDNPDELQFVLSNYAANPFVQNLMGVEYIKKAMDLIMGRVPGKTLVVQPAFNDDQVPNYALAIYTSGAEETQVLGDYGAVQQVAIEPVIFVTAKPIRASGNSLIFDNSKNLADKLWLEQRVVSTDGRLSAVMDGILIHKDAGTVEVTLRELIPLDSNGNTILPTCRFQSATDTMVQTASFSRDAVTMIAQLRTAGHREIHELFCLVIRYCLKRGRITFESNGFHTPTFAYSPPTPTYETQDVFFVTTFTISAKANDFWIDHKSKAPDCIRFELDVTNEDNPRDNDPTKVPVIVYGRNF